MGKVDEGTVSVRAAGRADRGVVDRGVADWLSQGLSGASFCTCERPGLVSARLEEGGGRGFQGIRSLQPHGAGNTLRGTETGSELTLELF